MKTLRTVMLDTGNRINSTKINTLSQNAWVVSIVRKLGRENVIKPTVRNIIRLAKVEGVDGYHLVYQAYRDGGYKLLCDLGRFEDQTNYHPDMIAFVTETEDITECDICSRKMPNWDMMLKPYLIGLSDRIENVDLSTAGGVSTNFNMCAMMKEGNIVAITTSDASLKSKWVSLGKPTDVDIFECIPSDDDSKDIAWVLHDVDDNVYTTEKTLTNKKGVTRTKEVYHTYIRKSRGLYNEETRENTKLVGYMIGKLYEFKM